MLKVKYSISIALRVNRETRQKLFKIRLAIEFIEVSDQEIGIAAGQFREALRNIERSAALVMVINIA